MIHPQVPLRIPCYDLTPLAESKFKHAKKRAFTTTPLAWFDGRCVQGAGAYSPQDVDLRLLRVPASRGRVAALDPNYEQVSGLPSPLGVGTHCPVLCSARVALEIRGIRTCRCLHLPLTSRQRSRHCAPEADFRVASDGEGLARYLT